MAMKDLLLWGLTQTPDGMSQMLTLGLESGPEDFIGEPMFKRNTNIYISKNPTATADNTNTVQLNVKDFSFNRDIRLDTIGRETLDSGQARILAPHVQEVNPVNFSFTTYILPTVDTNVTSPEEYLWTSLLGVDTIAGSPNSTPTSSTIDFSEGNVGTLQNLTLWFDQPNNDEASYRVDNAIIDSADIDFNITGIAEITWKGRALDVQQDGTPPTFTDRTNVFNYIKNKFSTITLDMNSTIYNLALTGGSVTINNRNKFYSREQLGKTSTPKGHYTGNRFISGTLNFYLKAGTNTSADLFNEIIANIDADAYEDTYDADITINIGGTTVPYVQLRVPRAILEIPNIDFSEALGISVPFTAKEGTSFYSTIIYNA